MNITDIIDVVGTGMPRRARRAVAMAFAALCLLSSGTASSLVAWYATHKADSIVHEFTRVMPTASPASNSP